MLYRISTVFLLQTLLFCGPLVACPVQDPANPPSDEPDKPKATIALEDLPWQYQLGIRSATLMERIVVIDRVVLVPDLATWLDEIGRWKQGAQWPVLLEDDRFTPLFVRRFQPRQLLRRASVGTPLPSDPPALEQLVNRTAVRAWGGDSDVDTLDSIYKSISWWTPPGIVATSYSDPAWPAALALALGRGELLRTIDGDFGAVNSSLDSAGFARLENHITRIFSESGYSWNSVGDDLDAFTICRRLAVRTDTPLPKPLRPNVPAPQQLEGKDPIAITDLICRSPEGMRWAVSGWIFGDHVRSIYMAMCSLFLERDSVLLVSAYSADGAWAAYSIDSAADNLREAGYEVVGVHGNGNATVDAWRRLMMTGPQADVLFMNTSGSAVQLNLARETVGSTRDIPSLDRPLALHMIHSYSLNSPDSITTVGGRWLDRGVYAYVGSCDEPYLPAFVTPLAVANRIGHFAPFLAASRMDIGPMAKPWRIVTIGDPLMLIEPPSQRGRKRVTATVENAEGTVDLRADTLLALRSAMETEGKTVDADTLESLHLLGQDELALKLWSQMKENDVEDDLTVERARAMLPVFFANRNATDYLSAYRLAGEPEGNSREMLWSLWTPRLATLRSSADLALFERALRPTQMADDLRVILPGLVRNTGSIGWNPAVAGAMDRATNDYDRMRLKELLK
jgi:hypothetical protein